MSFVCVQDDAKRCRCISLKLGSRLVECQKWLWASLPIGRFSKWQNFILKVWPRITLKCNNQIYCCNTSVTVADIHGVKPSPNSSGRAIGVQIFYTPNLLGLELSNLTGWTKMAWSWFLGVTPQPKGPHNPHFCSTPNSMHKLLDLELQNLIE